jgi:hypothetical protein
MAQAQKKKEAEIKAAMERAAKEYEETAAKIAAKIKDAPAAARKKKGKAAPRARYQEDEEEQVRTHTLAFAHKLGLFCGFEYG